MASTELLNATQVADMLGIKAVTLTMWRRRRRGPRFMKAPGRHRYLYRREDVDAWVQENGFAEFLSMRSGDGA